MKKNYELKLEVTKVKYDATIGMVIFRAKFRLVEIELYMLNNTEKDFEYIKEMINKAVGPVTFNGFVDVNHHLMIEEIKLKVAD